MSTNHHNSSLAWTAFLVLVLSVGSSTVQAQSREMVPLRLDGIVGTSISSDMQDGTSSLGKELALSATLAGFWKHPAILSYSFTPRYGMGHEVVPIEGNTFGAGNGVGGTLGFLTQGRFPLTMSFERQWSNTPNLEANNPISRVNELSSSQQTFNLGWSALLPTFGNYVVNYTKTNLNSETFLGSGLGENKNALGDLTITGEKKLRTFNLRGDYSSESNMASVTENPFDADARQRSYGLEATTTLPLHGSFTTNWRRTQSDFAQGGQTNSGDSDAVSANVSFQPWTRLGTYARALYNTGSNSGQLFTNGTSVVLTGLSSNQQQQIEVGTSATIGWGATAFANVGESTNTVTLGAASDRSSVATPSLEWRTGLTWGHKLVGGNASGSFTHGENAFTVNQGGLNLDGSGSARFTVQSNSATARYGRPIPAQIDLTVGGFWSKTDSITGSLSASNSRGWDVSATRPLGRWKLAGQWGSSSSDSAFLSTSTHSRNNMFSLKMSTNRMAFNVTQTFVDANGLTFGNGFVTVNDAIVASVIPELSEMLGSSTSIGASYRYKRHRLSGRWVRAANSNSGIDANNSAYDLRWEWKTRLIQFRGGVMRYTLEALNQEHRDTRVYFSVMRSFRLR